LGKFWRTLKIEKVRKFHGLLEYLNYWHSVHYTAIWKAIK
jgi:hypothetical protein